MLFVPPRAPVTTAALGRLLLQGRLPDCSWCTRSTSKSLSARAQSTLACLQGTGPARWQAGSKHTAMASTAAPLRRVGAFDLASSMRAQLAELRRLRQQQQQEQLLHEPERECSGTSAQKRDLQACTMLPAKRQKVKAAPAPPASGHGPSIYTRPPPQSTSSSFRAASLPGQALASAQRCAVLPSRVLQHVPEPGALAAAVLARVLPGRAVAECVLAGGAPTQACQVNPARAVGQGGARPMPCQAGKTGARSPARVEAARAGGHRRKPSRRELLRPARPQDAPALHGGLLLLLDAGGERSVGVAATDAPGRAGSSKPSGLGLGSRLSPRLCPHGHPVAASSTRCEPVAAKAIGAKKVQAYPTDTSIVGVLSAPWAS